MQEAFFANDIGKSIAEKASSNNKNFFCLLKSTFSKTLPA
ncbi:hypothetical protein NEOC65_000904 [Neochlamydia sp. AcF65]|nr:hypothetical protein [Neochlamydia sp. AcF65]MBS4169434.1 hypothetical protein [Neochlamydia sp. AcF95]